MALLGITLLLIIPMLTLPSDESPSLDPSGEVIDLRDDIAQRFSSPIHGNPYIAEARNGDMLTQAALWELYQNEQALRRTDVEGRLSPDGMPNQPHLYRSFDTYSSRSYLGVITIADAVESLMTASPLFDNSLETATDQQVKLAVHMLLQDPNTSQLQDLFSVEATSPKQEVAGIPIDAWTSPRLIVFVVADNSKLGGDQSRVGLDVNDTILNKEEFDRNVQEVLRGEQTNYWLWGIAIDPNLEAAEEGVTAGIYIVFTIIAVMVVVGLSLRSYWAMVLTGAGLGILMIWLRGISALVAIKEGNIIELLVPITMISLGVDFAVHALRRYEEERGNGYAPRMALQLGFAGVLGALVLAMLSDSIAFLSNTSSGLESVIHFGAAAGIAVFSSFLILGIGVPLAFYRIDQASSQRRQNSSRVKLIFLLLAGGAATVLFATSIILLVAVSQIGGVLLLFAAIAGAVLAPAMLLRRRSKGEIGPRGDEAPVPASQGVGARLSSIVTAIARYKVLVLVAALTITVISGFFAYRLDPKFDVKDFFDRNSDLVVSLDKMDRHVGQSSGEPALFYIKGDLADPGVLASIESFVANLADNPYISRDTDGLPEIWKFNILAVIRMVTSNDSTLAQVEGASNLTITDDDGDGIPESKEHIQAIYDYITTRGVPQDETTLVYTAAEIGRILSLSPEHGETATLIATGLPGSREQSTIATARVSLEDDLKILVVSPTGSDIPWW